MKMRDGADEFPERGEPMPGRKPRDAHEIAAAEPLRDECRARRGIDQRVRRDDVRVFERAQTVVLVAQDGTGRIVVALERMWCLDRSRQAGGIASGPNFE